MSNTIVAATEKPLLFSVEASWSCRGTQVLDRAHFSLRKGTIHALVGENGAGKTTLCHIIAGQRVAEAGWIKWHDGEASPRQVPLSQWGQDDAKSRRIAVMKQHGSLSLDLTACENLALIGKQKTVKHRELRKRLLATCEQMQWSVPLDTPLAQLQLSMRQRVELLLFLTLGANVLLLDEPTAILSPGETDALFRELKVLAAAGLSLVIVTHRLREVAEVADEVTVLRHGKSWSGIAPSDAAGLVAAMVGSTLPTQQRPAAPSQANIVLELSTVPGQSGTLTVAAGGIVGIAGVDGNGQQELCEWIAGIENVATHAKAQPFGTSGRELRMQGHSIANCSIRERIRMGIRYAPGDRSVGGLVMTWSMHENVLAGRQDIGGWRRDTAAEKREAAAIVADMDVRPTDIERSLDTLSGGHQQKFYIGKVLRTPNVRLCVLAHPTRGIDLHASAILWSHVHRLAASGCAFIIVSSDLDELLRESHDIWVMERGRVVGTFDNRDAAADRDVLRQQIGRAMAGHDNFPQKEPVSL